MLDSLQIEAELAGLGWTLDTRKAYAHGYSHPGVPQSLFVKVKKRDGQFQAVHKSPLVLHPSLRSFASSLSEAGGFKVELSPYFNTNLSGFPKARNAGATATQFGIDVSVDDAAALDRLLAALASPEGVLAADSEVDIGSAAPAQWPIPADITDEDTLHYLEADDYAGALVELEPDLPAGQRAMLIGHALAPMQQLSTASIASLGGYRGTPAGNLQYGLLASRIARHLDIDLPDGADKLNTIAALSDDRDAHGHQLWRLRAPVLQALRQLGWLPTDVPFDVTLHAAAQAEIDLDPQCQGLDATTRSALVNARIGQSDFRKQMMTIWQGRCAITGCDIADVLVASHAKAWAEASNAERLDPFNGLLLAASIDKLFDRGLISFDVNGQLLGKPWLSHEQLQVLGLSPGARLRFVKPQHLPYLAAHRAKHQFPA